MVLVSVFAAAFVFHGCKSFLLTSARARSPMSARCSTRKFITMNLAGGALNPLSKPELTGNEDAEEFASAKKHEAFLKRMGKLPQGFSVGAAELTFDPVEVPSMVDLPMRLTLILLDKPTTAWTALYTTNAFPGAPVVVGKRRLAQGGALQAIIINNKIANVCAGGAPGAGEKASEDICRGVGNLLSMTVDQDNGGCGDADTVGTQDKTEVLLISGSRGSAENLEVASAVPDAFAELVLPCSTGVIGWSLPVPAMLQAVPTVVRTYTAWPDKLLLVVSCGKGFCMLVNVVPILFSPVRVSEKRIACH